MPSRSARRLNRTAAALVLATALSVSMGGRAFANDVTYTSYTWIGDNVEILGPGEQIFGGAGQITLHTTTGSTILAWCIDIFDWLQNQGTYSVIPNAPINNGSGAISSADASHIGGLIVEGNALVAANQGTTVNGHNFTAADESAATQIAIWSTEYGSSFKYDTSIMPVGFTDLVAQIQANAGTASYSTLDPDPANCTGGQTTNCTNPTNQHLVIDPVPGPFAGTGLPGLLAACAALIVLARRRRSSRQLAST